MKKIFSIKFVLLFVLLALTVNSFAAKRYWISAATANWNNTANWSATSGGGGGSSVPGSSDTAYFDGSGVGRCDVDANVSVKRFEVKSTYGDTITQNAYTITVGTTGMILVSGVFVGSSSTITVNGDYNNSGCYFTSTSASLLINSGDFKLTGTGSFSHNNGALVLQKLTTGTDTCNIDISTSSSTKTMYDLWISAVTSASYRYIFGSGNVITVDHDFTANGSGTKALGAGTIELKGNATVSSGVFGGASTIGTLKFIGNASQTLTGSSTTLQNVPHVEIAKSGDTLKLSGSFYVYNHWVMTSGNLNSGTSKLYFGASTGSRFTGNFTGANSFNKLYFSQLIYYTTIDDTICAKDTIEITSGATIYKGTGAGVLSAKGNINIKGSYNFGGNTITLLINGSGTQIIREQNTGSCTLPPIKISKSSSDTVIFIGDFYDFYNWNYVSGIINSDNAKLIINNNNQTFTGSFTFKKVNLFYDSFNIAFNISSGSELTVTDSLWLTGSQCGNFNTGVINAKGAIVLTNTSTTGSYTGGAFGTGTIKINGTGNQTITGTATDTTMYLPHIEINKASGTLYLTNFIHAGGDWNWTNGTVNEGTSTIAFSRTGTITGNQNLYNVSFPGRATTITTIASGTTVTVNHTLSKVGSSSITMNTGDISAKGDISVTNSSANGGGSATITINGTGTQNFSGNSTVGAGPIPIIVINKSSGTLNLSNTISTYKNWTWTAGTVDAGTSTLAVCGTNTVTGSHTLNNVTLSAAATETISIASGTTLTVNGTLREQGTFSIIINTGTIEAKGDITIANTSTVTTSGGTGTILIDGTGTQTLTGSGIVSTGFLPKISINKSTGTLYLAGLISSNQDWSYTTGTVNATAGTGSTVWFRGTFNLDGQGTSTTMAFDSVFFGGSTTRTLTGNLNARGSLVINSSSTLASAGYAMQLGGHWRNNGTWTAGGSSLKIDGSGIQSINKASGTETFSNVTVYKNGGYLKLNCPVAITATMTPTWGKIISDTTNYLEIKNGATCVKGNDSAYVDGAIRKTGTFTGNFIFSLGDTSLSSGAFHPFEISSPSLSTDQYDVYYKAAAQTLGSVLDDSLENISDCEYWWIKRRAGSSSVTPTISWNSNWCNPNVNYYDLRVAQWNSGTSVWENQGNSTYSVSGETGILKAAQTTTGASGKYFVIGHLKKSKWFATMSYKPDGTFYLADGNYLRFKYVEEYMDTDNKLNLKVYRLGDNKVLYSNTASLYDIALGDNRINFDLTQLTGGAVAGYYLLEVTNDKAEKFYLKFKI